MRSKSRKWNVDFARITYRLQRFAVVFFAAFALLIFSLLKPGIFLTGTNLRIIALTQSVTVLLALAATLTLRLGDLDLSFGANMTTAGVLFAVLDTKENIDIPLSILVAVAFGACIGLVNSILVVRLGLSSFVATLGTMTMVEGIGFELSGSQVVSGVSNSFTNFMSTGPGTVPMAAIIGWIVAMLLWLVYQLTPFGSHLNFIGGNRRAADLLGIPVARVRTIAYVSSGALFGLAGVLLVGVVASADPTSSGQYLLPPLAAAFLGTTVIQLGRFNVVGTLIAAYTLAAISFGLQLLGANSWVQDEFSGGALILAIAFSRFAPGTRGAPMAGSGQ